MTRAASKFLLPLVLVLGGIAAYAGSFDGPFVYDDLTAIVHNESLSSFAGSLNPPPDTTVAGRPVLSVSLWLNHALGGVESAGYHRTNLLIHLLAGLLLFGIVRRTLSQEAFAERTRAAARGLGFWVAAIWLLHPLQTQSVTYVVQRAESLMGLFFLATLYCALRSFDGARSGRWVAGAIAASALGMATKEVMVAAPLVVLAFDWTLRPGSLGDKFRQRTALYGGLAATWLVLGALMASSPRSQSVGFDLDVGAWEYLLTQTGVLTHYLGLVLYPQAQSFDYSDWALARGLSEVLFPAVFVSLLFAGSVLALVQRRPAGLAGAVFFLVLAPTSSVLPIVTEVVAEQRMYLPLAAVAAILVCGLKGFLDRRSLSALATPLALVVVGVLGYLTHARNRAYDSVVSLWQATVDARPENARAYDSLGLALFEAGQGERALVHCRRALQLEPGRPNHHLNLGTVLNALGRANQAEEALRTALELSPAIPQALNGLGVALARQDRHDEALAAFRQALQVDPNTAGLQANLCGLHLLRGEHEQALRCGRLALELQPDDPTVRHNLGEALARTGDLAAAVEQLRWASRLDSDNPRRHRKLAQTLMQLERLDQAAVCYAAALALEFNLEDASLLARILATHPDAGVRDGARAVSLAERMVREAGAEDAMLLDTLGTAYAEAGRFDDAVLAAQRALRAPLPEGMEALAQGIRERLALYRQGLAYHL